MMHWQICEPRHLRAGYVLYLVSNSLFLFSSTGKMAAIPISAAYVRKLTKTSKPSHNKDCVNIQMKNEEDVKDLRRSLLRSFTFIHKISATCSEQAIRVYVEKNNSLFSSS